ncbi:MAG: nucleoside phosphorylase [Ruminococcus sp.]|nr:nucleoside phosphorylase [Ruminococcus sp.]
MILSQFDSNPIAVINPNDCVQRVDNMPKTCVMCYSTVTFNRIIEELDAKIFAKTFLANGEVPVYKAIYKGCEIALCMALVGAPSVVAILEDLHVMGIEKFIIFGTCGVLDRNISDCSVIIPNVSVRDEGTSYHYAPESDEINVNDADSIAKFTDILDNLNTEYIIGKAWTTDGIYRETRQKVEARKQQGCICVDMECSAVAAFAQFRKLDVFCFFYAADNLDNEKWDPRSISNDSMLAEKDKVAFLALELALVL